jgi:flagellar export protein FliJ
MASATARLEDAERGLAGASRRLEEQSVVPARSLVEAIEREAWLNRLEDELAACRVVRGIAEGELEEAKREWLECRMRRRALEVLRDRDYAEFQRAAERLEQKALDEFATNRRAG